MGGPSVLNAAAQSAKAVRLMTAHEHWLLCPLSLLWKNNRQVCDRPTCVSCVLAAGRLPQLWRHSGLRDRMLERLDALIVPSAHTRQIHNDRGVDRAIVHLPYFLPDELGADEPGESETAASRLPAERPYFVAAGRLVKEKGFSNLIAQMRHVPGADLKIAGAGPYEETLRAEAAGLPNVHFAGLLAYPELRRLYQGGRALIVPSLFHETFCYVVLEAFSAATPAIVHERGALPELVELSGGGDVYREQGELLALMKAYLADPGRAASLGRKGRATYQTRWNESGHVEAYLNLIAGCAPRS
jgi:glycosyltransferase involved in cell wall biosynthesis